MKRNSLLLLPLLALLLAGCSKEGFYEGMYHGLQQQGERFFVRAGNDEMISAFLPRNKSPGYLSFVPTGQSTR